MIHSSSLPSGPLGLELVYASLPGLGLRVKNAPSSSQLSSGSVILSIDDKPISSLPWKEAASMLRTSSTRRVCYSTSTSFALQEQENLEVLVLSPKPHQKQQQQQQQTVPLRWKEELEEKNDQIARLQEQLTSAKLQSRGTDGQIMLLRFQLAKMEKRLKKETPQHHQHQQLGDVTSAATTSFSSSPEKRASWLAHWRKSRALLQSLIARNACNISTGTMHESDFLSESEDGVQEEDDDNEDEDEEEEQAAVIGGDDDEQVVVDNLLALSRQLRDQDENEASLRHQLAVQSKYVERLQEQMRVWVEAQIEMHRQQAEALVIAPTSTTSVTTTTTSASSSTKLAHTYHHQFDSAPTSTPLSAAVRAKATPSSSSSSSSSSKCAKSLLKGFASSSNSPWQLTHSTPSALKTLFAVCSSAPPTISSSSSSSSSSFSPPPSAVESAVDSKKRDFIEEGTQVEAADLEVHGAQELLQQVEVEKDNEEEEATWAQEGEEVEDEDDDDDVDSILHHSSATELFPLLPPSPPFPSSTAEQDASVLESLPISEEYLRDDEATRTPVHQNSALPTTAEIRSAWRAWGVGRLGLRNTDTSSTKKASPLALSPASFREQLKRIKNENDTIRGNITLFRSNLSKLRDDLDGEK